MYSQKVSGKVYFNLQRLENIKRDCMVFLFLNFYYLTFFPSMKLFFIGV